MGLKREIQSLSMDKARRWLRVKVNMDRHKSSRNMQTTRYERLSMVREKRTIRREPPKVGEDSPPIFTFPCFKLRRPNTSDIPSPHVSFLVWCVLESHNSFSLSANPKGPKSEGCSSFPAGLKPWFHLSLFIIVLTEVFEFSSKVFIAVRISRSGSMICKWRIFRSSGRNTVLVTDSLSLVTLFGICGGVEKLDGGVISLPFVMPEKHNQASMRSKGSLGGVPANHIRHENLDRDGECGFDYLTFTLVSSKAPRKGVGLRVADSYASNHTEGGFTPFETIRRLLVVIGRRSRSGFKGETFEPERRVSVYCQTNWYEMFNSSRTGGSGK
ncbi:hypothetical protein Tco_1039749 [Tanacetum coccineum]